MARIKQVCLCFIIMSMLFVLTPGSMQAMQQAVEVTSNQYTQADTVNTDWEISQEIPDTFSLIGENTNFQLYADKTSLAFKVVDKRSGYVWHSNVDEKIEGDKLNKTWLAFAQSGISIEYLDKKAVSKRISVTNADVAVDLKPIEQGFEASIKFNLVSITIKFSVQLEDAGVRISAPFDGLKQEDADYKLSKLYVYPFMGATRSDSVPGYMFIPDGPGSLVRFSATTKAKNMFYGRYYGADLGMIAALPWDPTIKRPFKISMPVFGMLHGYKQNAFIAITEKGASYGEIQAHPAGIITNFNFLYNAFIYNESYFQPTNRSGAGVTTIQKNTNVFDVEMHYRFLTGEASDYVGMAKSYQQYLVEKGDLQKVSDDSGDIGIRLEFLGGEKEKVLFWDRSVPMTTIPQMGEILDDLAIQNTDVIYYGWQPHGASNMPPASLVLDGKLGTLGQLSTVAEKVTAGGGNFYLYLDPQAAFYKEGGYSPRFDLAMSITDLYLIGYNRDKVNFYFNLSSLSQRLTTLCTEANSKVHAGLALDAIGSTVYSDFKPNHLLSREEAIASYRDLMSKQECGTAFYMPNQYMYRFMRAYYDMPLTSSGYIYTTDLVPFVEIVLAGYVPYYGSALNFSSNLQEDLLRQVDFGVYPSYFLTKDVTAKILNTRSNWIYTSSYDQWGKAVKETYAWLNALLGPVKGAEITARQVLEDGVVAVTYRNGKQIIINYSYSPFSIDDLVIDAKDAAIREVLP